MKGFYIKPKIVSEIQRPVLLCKQIEVHLTFKKILILVNFILSNCVLRLNRLSQSNTRNLSSSIFLIIIQLPVIYGFKPVTYVK